MARRLPSLNALRAFEAAARHVSFTDAATELFVTHAAVSRHIRELEEWLGTQLFDNMAEATLEAAAQGTVRTLNVSVEPAIASRWLVPRLGRFNELHPDIELNIDPDNRLVDFRSDRADLGIRYGLGRWGDVEVQKLISDVDIFPVCSPRLIKKARPASAADLANYNLL